MTRDQAKGRSGKHCGETLRGNGKGTEVRNMSKKIQIVDLPSIYRPIARLALTVAIAFCWSAGAAQISQKMPQQKFYLGPSISKVTPDHGPGDTWVTITGGDLSGVTAVMFGGQSANFTIQSNTSIKAYAPLKGIPGNTVPVTAISGGQVVPTTAMYSYPIAEMEVDGPLPYPRNSVSDMSWYNGTGHSISVTPPQTIQFALPAPTLHVDASFADDTPNYPSGSYQGDLIGNEGSFSVMAEMCSLNGKPSFATSDTGQPCTNHDQNTGTWVTLPEQHLTLSSPGSGQTARGDITVSLGPAFDQSNFARTFRLQLSLQQLDTHTGEGNSRQASKFSSPFTVVVTPAALVELNVVPHTILYQPPGDQSTASFTANTTYGTNFSLGNSTGTSNSSSNSQKSSVKTDASLSYFFGFSLGQTQNWDTTTKESFGTTQGTTNTGNSGMTFQGTWSTQADTNLLPGSGATCASPTDCSQTKQDPNIRSKEPFWLDRFILLVHPQFAVWVLGQNQPNRYVMYGAVPVTANVNVIQLDACASGQKLYGVNQCIIDYSDDGLMDGGGKGLVYQGQNHSIEITAAEATNLLKLDPFYSGGQGASLPETRAIPVTSATYGAKIQTPPTVYANTLSNVTQTQQSNNNQLTHSTTVSDVIGSDQSEGMSFSFSQSSVGYKEGVTLDNGEQTSFDSGITTTFTDSTAVSNQQVTTATVTLNDVDNTSAQCKTCHDPLPDYPSVNIFLDRMFGSFMFQDPGAPHTTTPPMLTAQERSVKLVAAATKQEQSSQRFNDVAKGSACQVAAGLLARTHIMSGDQNGRFRPDDPMTRAQLAASLARALNLSAPAGRQFTDLPSTDASAPAAQAAAQAGLLQTPSATLFGPSDPVSRQEMAAALAKGFNLSAGSIPAVTDSNAIAPASVDGVNAMVANGFMKTNADGSFGPRTPVTRCEAAQIMVAVLNDREAKLYGPATSTTAQRRQPPAQQGPAPQKHEPPAQPAPANSTILVPDNAYPGGLLTGVVVGPDDKPVPNTPVEIAGAVPATLGGEVVGDATPCAAGDPACQPQPQQPVAGNVPAGTVPPPRAKPAPRTVTPASTPSASGTPAGSPINCASILKAAANTPAGAPVAGQPGFTPAGVPVNPATGAAPGQPGTPATPSTPGVPGGTQVMTDALGRFALCMAPSAPSLSVNLPGSPTKVAVSAVQGAPPAVDQPPDFFQGGQKITFNGGVRDLTATQNDTTWQLPVARAWSPDGKRSVTVVRTPLQLQPGAARLNYTGNDGQPHSTQASVFRIVRAFLDHSQLRSDQGATFEYDVQFAAQSGRQLCVKMHTIGPVVMVKAPPEIIVVDASGLGRFGGKIRATPVAPGSTVPFDLTPDIHVCGPTARR